MEIEDGAVQATDAEFTEYLHRAITFSLLSDVGRDRVRVLSVVKWEVGVELVEEHFREPNHLIWSPLRC